MEYLGQKDYAKYREFYAANLCQEWNSLHPPDEQVLTFQIYFLEKTNYLDGSESVPRKLLLWDYPSFHTVQLEGAPTG